MGLRGLSDVAGEESWSQDDLRIFHFGIQWDHNLKRKYGCKSKFGERKFILDMLNLSSLHGLCKQ